MTTIALPARRNPTLRAVVPHSTVRLVALLFVLCVIFGAGIAAAARLGGATTQPTESQQPSLTLPTSR